MKKKISILFVVVLLGILGTSCTAFKSQNSGLPDFVKNPPVATDAYYGVGYAKQSELSMSIKIAEARARADIANQVRVTIQEIVKAYIQDAGNLDDKQVVTFADTATKQITNNTIQGAVVTSRVPLADGGVWVLAKMDLNTARSIVIDTINNTAQSFSRSEAAAFAEWKAEQVFKYMDDAMASGTIKSVPVTDQ